MRYAVRRDSARLVRREAATAAPCNLGRGLQAHQKEGQSVGSGLFSSLPNRAYCAGFTWIFCIIPPSSWSRMWQ
jgi:hypothetical protein